MTKQCNFDEGINRYPQSASHRAWDSLSMAVNLYTEPNGLISAQPPVFFDFADATGDSRIDETGAICNGKKGVAGSHDIDDAITPSHHYFAPFASVSTSDAVNSTTCVSPAKYFHCAACWGGIPLVPDQTRPSSSFEHQPIDRSGRHILAVAGIARVWIAARSLNSVPASRRGLGRHTKPCNRGKRHRLPAAQTCLPEHTARPRTGQSHHC